MKSNLYQIKVFKTMKELEDNLRNMKFDLNEEKEVVVLLGAGDMGLAIIKRISAGKKNITG